MTVKSMQVNEDKTVTIEVSVEAEAFSKAVDEAYRKNSKRMQVPGFRRGKAPRKMIEKMYGTGVFYEDAVNATYPAAYEAAIDEKNIEPVDRASVEILDVNEQGYTFKATVAVKPEVSLKEYKGLKAEKEAAEVTENEINNELERRREHNGRMVSVEDRAAQNGDTAVIDFEGFADGVPFAGGKGEKHPLELGSNSFIPGFEEQVVGKKIGEEFEVNVTFPADYHAEELKGKAVVFKCKLHEIKVKELPELDDEFAKDISEFDTLDELRADIRAKMTEDKESKAQSALEDNLLEQVCEGMTADIPACMFESRVDEMVKDFEYRLQSQGMNLKHYLGYTGSDLESFRKSFAPQAEAQVKTRLALEEIVRLEKFVPTAEEIEQEYEKIAKSYNMEVEKIRPLLPQKDIEHNIAMGKALDLVRDSAVVSEGKASAKKAAKPAAKKAADEETEDKPKKPRAPKKPKAE